MMSAVLFSTILRPSWNAFPKLFKERCECIQAIPKSRILHFFGTVMLVGLWWTNTRGFNLPGHGFILKNSFSFPN
nr:hypothetical protein Iba_chr04aCG8610 [Ipomoea batatas]